MTDKKICSESMESSRASVSAKTSRKPYFQPRLACYGSVAKLTKNGGGPSADGTGNSMTIRGSDPSIKENIVKIGNHPLGIGLYLFDYKPTYREECGYGRQFGVMADEVEAVMPKAVSLRSDGFRQVDYMMLGIERTIH